jgi:hypothetical protein
MCGKVGRSGGHDRDMKTGMRQTQRWGRNAMDATMGMGCNGRDDGDGTGRT